MRSSERATVPVSGGPPSIAKRFRVRYPVKDPDPQRLVTGMGQSLAVSANASATSNLPRSSSFTMNCACELAVEVQETPCHFCSTVPFQACPQVILPRLASWSPMRSTWFLPIVSFVFGVTPLAPPTMMPLGSGPTGLPASSRSSPRPITCPNSCSITVGVASAGTGEAAPVRLGRDELVGAEPARRTCGAVLHFDVELELVLVAVRVLVERGVPGVLGRLLPVLGEVPAVDRIHEVLAPDAIDRDGDRHHVALDLHRRLRPCRYHGHDEHRKQDDHRNHTTHQHAYPTASSQPFTQRRSHSVTHVVVPPWMFVRVARARRSLTFGTGSPFVCTMSCGKLKARSVAVPVKSACGSLTPHPVTS